MSRRPAAGALTPTSLLRLAVRRAVPFVSNRPWLISLAARAFAVSPSLKYRVRRLMAGSGEFAAWRAGRGARPLTPHETAVLTDLRDEIAARGTPR